MYMYMYMICMTVYNVCGVKEGERERDIQLLVLILCYLKHQFSCELLELLYMHSMTSIHSNMRATLL